MANHPNRSTTAAARIAKRLNSLPFGGFCVFDADGKGGAFYTDGSRPELPEGGHRFSVPVGRLTARDVHAMLDARHEDDEA